MAPNKIFVSSDPFGFMSAYDMKNHPSHGEEYVRKDALLEYLQKEYETNKWFYDTHTQPGELHVGRCEAYKKVIDKIESL